VAAHLEAGPRSVVARGSAARLLGLPGYARATCELLVPRGHDHRARLGVVRETAWLPPGHVTVVDSLPCTRAARCLFDLAGDMPRHLRRNPRGRAVHARRVERALDSALARSLTTIDQLTDVLHTTARHGRPGSALLRALLAERTVGFVPVASELEARFVELCRSAGLPEPRRQVGLGGSEPIGRVDFLFADHGLVVEVDGGAFHDDQLDHEHDRRRDNQLAALGLRVVRVRWRDVVDDPAAVVALLRAALAAGRRREAA